jgi:hypothetical protein
VEFLDPYVHRQVDIGYIARVRKASNLTSELAYEMSGTQGDSCEGDCFLGLAPSTLVEIRRFRDSNYHSQHRLHDGNNHL